MRFSDWLRDAEAKKTESMTSTADIASFSRPIMPINRRQWPNNGKDEEEDDDVVSFRNPPNPSVRQTKKS